MKKIISILLFIASVILSCVALVACGMKYRVTFYEGENINYQTIDEGEKAVNYTPSKPGYEFLGWYTEDDTLFDFDEPITKNINLYAYYSMNEWTVTFVIDQADESKNIVQKVNTNFLVDKVKDPVKENYIFTGWVYNDQVFDFKTKVTSDMTIYAKYVLDSEFTPKLTVTFNTINGGDIEPMSVRRLDKIGELPTPSKEGFKFIGWYYNDELIDSEYVIKQIDNFVLIARYSDN